MYRRWVLGVFASVVLVGQAGATEPARDCLPGGQPEQQFTLPVTGPGQAVVTIRYRPLDRNGVPVEVELSSPCPSASATPVLFTPAPPVREKG